MKVFGRTTHHGGAADVDVFDDGVKIVRFGDGFFEGVEVHAHKVDARDAVFVGGLYM